MRVELRRISKRFGLVQANQEVSLVVEAGMIYGLLGENGAGKSTLVKILSGLVRRDSGEILLNGQPQTYHTPQGALRAGIGMLHQDPLDFPQLTVLENFMSGGSPWQWLPRRQARAALEDLSACFHFRLPLQEPVGSLSVGERQQLEILRLLHLGVQTLILDEPTTGISAQQKTALFAALKTLAEQGKSILFVSHKLADVQSLCHQVGVMRQGRLVGSRSLPCGDQELIAWMFGKPVPIPAPPPPVAPQPQLQLQQVQLQTPRFVLGIPEMTLYRGEVIGLAGLEGSGQEFFLRACAGLYPITQGSLRLGEQELAGQPYRVFCRAGIAYVPANRLSEGLIPGLTIVEHVALRYPPPGWLWQRQQSFRQAQALIQHFNIRGQAHSRVDQLSGGNQQRTQLALLPPDLRLLLLEHPTRGLDMESADWIWQQLQQRCQRGATVIFMSADLDEIRTYSHRILVFSGGWVSDVIPVPSLEELGSLLTRS
ncbi:MAG: ATP-binding cassette domain-containing protein [Thermostichales cyanobacterium HHBFW_bins_127]